MTTRRQLLATFAAASAASLPIVSRADSFPSKPITLLVPFTPGGIADITARTVAQAMGPLLGQTIVVDNRPSAGSIVASQAAGQGRP